MGGRKLWTILAALWFLVYGLLAVTNVTVDGAGVVMGFLAILIAVFLLFDR